METTPKTPEETLIETPGEFMPESVDAATTKVPRAKKKPIPLTPAMKADPISRKLIRLSLIFAGLAFICIGLLTFIHLQKKHSHSAAVTESGPAVAPRAITQALDEIRVTLKNEQELRVEMVEECSQLETCDF